MENKDVLKKLQDHKLKFIDKELQLKEQEKSLAKKIKEEEAGLELWEKEMVEQVAASRKVRQQSIEGVKEQLRNFKENKKQKEDFYGEQITKINQALKTIEELQ